MKSIDPTVRSSHPSGTAGGYNICYLYFHNSLSVAISEKLYTIRAMQSVQIIISILSYYAIQCL